MQEKDQKMKQANHNKRVHLIISGSQIHMGEAWFSYWYSLVFTKLLIWYWTSHYYWSNELESNNYPLLQDSKGEIDWHMHTYIAKDMISVYSHI